MKPFSLIVLSCILLTVVLCDGQIARAETPRPYEEPTLLAGTIYDSTSSTERILYRFKRTSTRSEDTVTAVREFSYPDSKLAARERVVYRGDQLESFELEELQNNARGTAKVQRTPDNEPSIAFEYQPDLDSPKKVKRNTEPLRPDTMTSDMIAPFLRTHWDALMKGESVRCRYIVVPRAETIAFKFIKQPESSWHGKPVVVVKMAPVSLVIAALVDPLYFTMEKDGTHRVLQYVGRTTPKRKSGNEWKDLDAVTVFDWH